VIFYKPSSHKLFFGGPPPYIFYTSSTMADHSVETCPICLCPVEHLAIITNCEHHFCYTCITKWAKSKLYCPMCKSEFTNIQHTPDPLKSFVTETLPPPVVTTDTSTPDLECLTDTYFLVEVSRLLANAKKGKNELFRSSQKQRNDYGFTRLNQVINRLNEIKLMLESDQTFSPYLVLTELYEVDSVLQLLWSGRVDELALSFPETSHSSTRRRYGADDYQQYEGDESEDDYEYLSVSRKQVRGKVKYDDDDYYY